MQQRAGKHLAIEILFALLLLLLLAALLITEISRAHDAHFYERADVVTYTYQDELFGYIFRDEIAPETLNNGPVDYCVPNGVTVTAGEELAHVYRDDSATNKRNKAAALYAEIAELEAALAAKGDWKNAYLDSYTALMRELSAGNTVLATLTAKDTAGAIGGRDAEQKEADILSRITELRAELDALTVHTSDYRVTYASVEGVFYHSADGYEATFGANQIEKLTPSSLSALLAAEPKLGSVIGKLVCSEAWYLAVPLDSALAATYTAGQNYPLHFPEGSVTMTLERIHTDDTDQALLIFAADTTPEWLSPARRQSVRVEKGSVSGLCIPEDALTEENTIFVLEDGVARLRQVTPLIKEQGCVLLSPQDPALAEGEYVIVSTKQLFDGKVLK